MSKPKILLYDIETSPNLGYTWGKYDQNVIRFAKERELLSVAYKWLGSKEVLCATRKGQKTDKHLVNHIARLFEEADIIIAHNGDAFDEKIVKSRMIKHGLKPTKRTTSVDTKKAAKAYFGFNGNGLEDLARFFELGSKLKHGGFDIWLGCMKDDAQSWREMIKYNKQDVVLLEKVYEKLRPWIHNHPNIAKLMNVRAEGSACPNCGSDHVHRCGYRATHSQIKRQMHCQSCKGWFLTKLEKEGK